MNTSISTNNTGPVIINANNKRKDTKKEKAKDLYLKHYKLSRKELIDKFCEELFVDRESATTYISWSAKALNPQLGLPYITRNIDKSKLKREKAYEIFSKNPNLSRKEIISLMQSSLHMTQNSAATHCSMSAKKYMKEHLNAQHKAILS